MQLSTKAVGWHGVSVLSGAFAAISFASLHQVDVYAIFDQLNQTIADLTKLFGMLSAIAALAGGAYRTWNEKQVPAGERAVDVGAPSKAVVDAAHPPGNTAEVATINGMAVGKIVGALLVGFLVLGSFQPAHAQLRKPQVTGDIIADIKANNAAGVTPAQGLDATWAKMKAVSLDDLKYAKALADGVSSSRSKIRSTCYGAWIAVIEQSQGATAGANGQPLGAPPDPALFTKFEQAVQVADNLQPDSPFMVACQPAANLLKQSILQFVTSAVGGVTSLGTLGLGIP